MRIPHRKGHSIQRDVRLAGIGVRLSHRINGCIRVGPNGRDLELLLSNSDRTTVDESYSVSVSFLSKNDLVSYNPRDLDGG